MSVEKILELIRKQRPNHQRELSDYLTLPSISSRSDQKEVMMQTAEMTRSMMVKSGLDDAAVYETPGHPVVMGSNRKKIEAPTLLIYGHYDVQPVDPLDEWETPPFQPDIRNNRLFARGSTDDKGQVHAHLKALEAIFSHTGELPLNVVVLVEGEEEIGSPNLVPFLNEHRDALNADLAVVSDTFMWAEGQPAIVCGLRGLLVMEISVTGPNRDLHSGFYGGAVANPIEILARMLAQVKDDNGRILIPGFLDSVTPLTEMERNQIAEIPFDEQEFLSGLSVEKGWGDPDFSILEKLWARPTFEINGLWGGFIDEGVKTVLPAKANAKITMRLVPDQNPQQIADAVSHFFHSIAPASVTVETKRISGGGPGIVIPTDTPAMLAASHALEATFGKRPYFSREGVSIPVVNDFREVLGIETLLIGLGLPDARPHSPNENLHLPTYHLGIEAMVRLYHQLATL
ncbi:MAG: dipeptidase [Magnetococcales bacterium]|nr:dipeptidase [Magnetococcales bacterium]